MQKPFLPKEKIDKAATFSLGLLRLAVTFLTSFVITQSGRGFRICWRLPTTADLREGFMSQEEAGRKRDFEGVYSINHNEIISPSLLVRYPTRSPISKSAAVLCILVGVWKVTDGTTLIKIS